MRNSSVLQFLVISVCSVFLVGCGGSVTTPNPEPTAVTGTVIQKGQPVANVVLNFQPTGAGALPAVVPLKDGKFEAQISPGRYTWYLSEGSGAESRKAFATISEEFQAGSLDRQIDVEPGKPLQLEVN